MANVWITVDVEAQTQRASGDHVDRLIWGRFGEGEHGIGRMMDIADRHDVPMTMFVDFAETDLYGEQMYQVGREILSRGHDLQLHVHPNFFDESVWHSSDINAPTDLNGVSTRQAGRIVSEILKRYRKVSSDPPLAFRGPGYTFNENLLRSLYRAGVLVDSSVNRSRKTQPFATLACKQFLWPNGLLEVPVAVIDGYRNLKRPFDFNFNASHFLSNDETAMLAYLDHFENQYGEDAIAVLVMHSWSLLDISNAHFGPHLEKNTSRLSAFLERSAGKHRFHSSASVLSLLKDGALALDGSFEVREDDFSVWRKVERFRPSTPKINVAAASTTGSSSATNSARTARDSRWQVVDVAHIRREICKRPLGKLDDLDTSSSTNHNYLRSQINALVENGWERWDQKLASLEPPLPWREESDSFNCSLHAWDPLGIFLLGYSEIGDRSFLEVPLRVAEDWVWQNVRTGRDLVRDDPKEDDRRIDQIIRGGSTARWYDMTVGKRVYRLAYILDVAARMPEASDELIGWLYSTLVFHHRLLSRSEFYVEQTNHGIYQALGQLAAARRFRWIAGHEDYLQLALARVRQLVDRHFFADGVHKEHSPGYHYMVLGSFRGAADSGLFDDSSDLIERMHGMERVLGEMIQPDGGLVSIGDTDPRQLVMESREGGVKRSRPKFSPRALAESVFQATPFSRSSRGQKSKNLQRPKEDCSELRFPNAMRFEEETLRYILSRGELGAAPEPGVASYPDAGYAFFRMFAPHVETNFENASYLAQHAGYHSRTHKHADHLSFVWYDRNRQVLIDPGRYAYVGRTDPASDLARQGFRYSDPKRIYVESTRAHNCVEIDGKSYPRAGVGGRPFGSALKYAGAQNGLALAECEATHFRYIRHWRGLIMAPGHFLVVLDWLYDRTPNARHDFRQWFQLDAHWLVEGNGEIVRAVSPQRRSRKAETLVATSLLPDRKLSDIIRGQEQPHLQGWHSDMAYSLAPSPSFNFALTGTALGQFATIFTFGEGIEVDRNSSDVNRTMRAGKLAWKDGRGKHTLSFSRESNSHLQVAMKSTR